MNYNEAIKILDIADEFNEKELKRCYYIKALRFHPDKNNGVDVEFKKIVEAYEYLNKNKNNDSEDSYLKLLNNFMDFILNKNIEVNDFINSLNETYSKLTIELLKKFSKKTLLKINKFIKNYGFLLNIGEEIREKVSKLIEEHTKYDKMQVINVTIENLLNDEIYKFEFKNEIYYIPLWHQESEFEIDDNLLIIECEHILPDCLEIDENNNLYLKLETNLKDIMNDDKIKINISDKSFEVLVNKLFIKKYQRYTIVGKGISLINTKNIYNIDYRGNIYIDIYFKDID